MQVHEDHLLALHQPSVLKLETVSRSFSKFQDDGLLEVKQRNVRVPDEAALRRVLHDTTPEHGSRCSET